MCNLSFPEKDRWLYRHSVSNENMEDEFEHATTSQPMDFFINLTELVIRRPRFDVELKFYVEKYATSSIALFGILGNLLNIAVLTTRQFNTNVSKLERSSLLSLIALALSDLFVCLCFFAKVFLPARYKHPSGTALHPSKEFWFHWDKYGEATTNIFIVWSTWLTVSMAVSRYVALCHPMRARAIVGLRSTKLSIFITFLFAIALNVPSLLITVSRNHNGWNYNDINQFGKSFTYTVIGWIHICLGTFLPIALLILCNVSLVKSLRQSEALRRQCTRQTAPDDDKRHRITLTLVIIILMFLTCVAPSRLIVFVIDATLSNQDSFSFESYMDIVSTIQCTVTILNLMVAINYAINFLLYCVVNVYFRQVICSALRGIFHPFNRRNSHSMRNDAGAPLVSSLRSVTIETRI